MSLKITGKLPSGKLLQQIQLSPNYKEGAFQNLSHTPHEAGGGFLLENDEGIFLKTP